MSRRTLAPAEGLGLPAFGFNHHEGSANKAAAMPGRCFMPNEYRLKRPPAWSANPPCSNTLQTVGVAAVQDVSGPCIVAPAERRVEGGQLDQGPDTGEVRERVEILHSMNVRVCAGKRIQPMFRIRWTLTGQMGRWLGATVFARHPLARGGYVRRKPGPRCHNPCGYPGIRGRVGRSSSAHASTGPTSRGPD